MGMHAKQWNYVTVTRYFQTTTFARSLLLMIFKEHHKTTLLRLQKMETHYGTRQAMDTNGSLSHGSWRRRRRIKMSGQWAYLLTYLLTVAVLDDIYRRLAALSLIAEKRIFFDSICLILSATEGIFSASSSSPCISYSLHTAAVTDTMCDI